ncbi:hypothetical protein C8R43DRAFT_497076 [Mycena crocata]|nr:hypothetical protein C8R43DRAFT_497076 [Mycena crocata]
MPDLLDLPPELILSCLAHLNLTDIHSCLKAGNRVLASVIVNSVLIRYRLELGRACVEESMKQAGNQALADRLASLRTREDNWRNFTPRSRHTVAVDFQTSGIYDLASDVYLVGDRGDSPMPLCTGLKYMVTPPGPEGPEWRRIEAGKPIIDFGVALAEHDLIAMVTYTPHANDPLMRSIDVALIKFSTGVPHPLAAHPTLHIHDVELFRGRPGISIEIVGRNLTLSLLYWADERRDLDTLHVYDWQSGVSKMEPLSVNNTGIVFLTEDTFIIPNSLDASLDVFRIPASGSDAVPKFIHSFNLPELEEGHSILSFQCRGEPNPRSMLNFPSTTTFLPTPQTALLIFTFEVGTRRGSSEHLLVLERPPLAALAALCPFPEGVTDTDWRVWGPPCARWLDAAPLAMNYITIAAGQRVAAIAHDAGRTPAPIVILDFNPMHVEAQREIGLEVVGEDARVRVVEADCDPDAMPGGEDSEQKVEALPFAELNLPWAEPVHSLLPYVETVSTELFDYGAVLLNDANVIGAKFGERYVESLEVLHFG